MKDLITIKEIEELIVDIRDKKVILDSDIAKLYEVPTREINRAVKNNPEKFPQGYVLELNKSEFQDLRWKFSTAKLSKMRATPKSFTEKGVYMLATILKSKKATQTTISIIETFDKLNNVKKILKSSSENKRNLEEEQIKSISKLLNQILKEEIKVGPKTSIEINLAIIKIKHTFD